MTRSNVLLGAVAACLVVALQGCGGCDPPAGDDAGPGKADSGPNSQVGTADCPCGAAPNLCEVDLTCSGGACVPCAAGSAGCPCDDGACDATLACDDQTTTCRALLDCAAADCAPNQLCDAPAGADATCLPACDPGYTYDGAADSCTATPSCDAAAPGSLVDACALDGRVCDDTLSPAACGACLATLLEVDGACVTNDCAGLDCGGRLGRLCVQGGAGPSCTDCDTGHVLDGAASPPVCVDRITCADQPCLITERCDEATVGSDRTCRPAANCDPGQVESQEGNCLPCTTCFSSGATLQPHALGIANNGEAFGNICVCELEEGYFQPTSGGAITACDADDDGWVTDLILPVLAQGATSPLFNEQNCHIRTIDRFELRSDDVSPATATKVREARVVTVDDVKNEYSISDAAVLPDALDPAKHFVRLVEPASMDDEVDFALRYTTNDDKKLIAYGGIPLAADPAAHRFLASEVNPLTKACNDDNDDLNLDGVKDVLQTHEPAAIPTLLVGLAATPLFFRMAYFIELDRGFYIDTCNDDGSCYGTYVIAEKSRADGPDAPEGLELSYNDAAGAYPEADSYWTQCMRGRDPRYAGVADDQYNLDYANWYQSCASPTGFCHRDTTATGDYIPYDGRDPGLLTALGALTADADPTNAAGRWPGMNHSSQFKCVSFNATGATNVNRRPPVGAVARTAANANAASPANTGDFTLMPCGLGDTARSVNPGIGSSHNPRDPVMSCKAVIDTTAFNAATLNFPTQTQNFFIGLRFPSYDTPLGYRGGCIDEHAEWPFLCKDTAIRNSQGAFGKLFCGCADARGGTSCEIGCAESRVLANRQGNLGEISGFWMCATTAASDNPTISDGLPGGFTLTGSVPAEVVPTTKLCQVAGCATGFAISAPGR